MGGNIGFLILVVFIVLVINFFVWFRRHGKSLRSSRKSMTEEHARVIRHNEIQRRFEREQEDALEYIEKRNKTLDLYEQVRKQAEATEKAAATVPEPPQNSENEPEQQ